MVAIPPFIPVTTPVAGITLAMVGVPELHVPAPTLASVIVSPGQMAPPPLAIAESRFILAVSLLMQPFVSIPVTV
jgi:hypothetical protein